MNSIYAGGLLILPLQARVLPGMPITSTPYTLASVLRPATSVAKITEIFQRLLRIVGSSARHARDTLCVVLLFATTAHAQPAGYYDYTADLHRDCLQAGLGDTSMFGVPLCRIVEPEPLTKAEALKRNLQYRAIGWGKLFPADEAGYFIAESGEFIPESWSVPSPDDQFHRCTYSTNDYWSGPPDNAWKIKPDRDTRDGLPPTRCFWRPAGK